MYYSFFDNLKMLSQVKLINLESGLAQDEIEELIRQVKDEWSKKRRREIEQSLGQASRDGDKDKQLIEKLLIELQNI